MPPTQYREARRIPQFKVKYKDVFHLKNLYIMMHEYLSEEGWRGPVSGGKGVYEHSDIETLYLEKFCQKGLHAGGKEMWVYWRTSKPYEGKYSGYFKNHLDLDFHMVYMQDIEVVHQGKKMKIQKGEIEMFFRAWIEADYRHLWEKHWLLKHLQDIYERRIMIQELDKREKELWREAYRLQNRVKRYLNMRIFIPTPEPFHHPIYGYEG